MIDLIERRSMLSLARRQSVGPMLLLLLTGCGGATAQAPSGAGPVGLSASELEARGRAFESAGRPDSALAYYGSVLSLSDTTRARAMASLLSSSPILEPQRSLPAEAVFVRDVRALVAASPAGAARAAEIGNTDQAMAALEALMAHRKATIEVRYPTPGFVVAFRRWIFRDDPAVLWETLVSDTAITAPAAAYQFRFRPAGASRDTIVTVPCANGCRVPPGQ